MQHHHVPEIRSHAIGPAMDHFASLWLSSLLWHYPSLVSQHWPTAAKSHRHTGKRENSAPCHNFCDIQNCTPLLSSDFQSEHLCAVLKALWVLAFQSKLCRHLAIVDIHNVVVTCWMVSSLDSTAYMINCIIVCATLSPNLMRVRQYIYPLIRSLKWPQ